MANFGSLGIGGALNNALNTGLDTANKFAEYQQNRYLEASDQINKLSGNEANIWANHNETMRQAARSLELANLLQTAPRPEVQAAQAGQQYIADGNAQIDAVNGAALQSVLNQSVYGTNPMQPTPQAFLTPEQIGQQFRDQLQLNGGNPQASLEGVINGR